MEHCCTGASPEEFELEVGAAEPEFVIVAKLRKGLHLLGASWPQESSIGLEAEEVERVFENSKLDGHRYSLWSLAH